MSESGYKWPDAATIAGAVGVPVSWNGWYMARGECHGGTHSRTALNWRDGTDGFLVVKCHAGCSRRNAIAGLERLSGLKILGPTNRNRERPMVRPRKRGPVTVKSVPEPESQATLGNEPPSQDPPIGDKIAALQGQHEGVPLDPRHPGRRWLTHFNVWRPEIPAPTFLRWLPIDSKFWEGIPKISGPDSPGSAGALIAPLAPLRDWIREWPKFPIPWGFTFIFVSEDGTPATGPSRAGKRVNKKSWGTRKDSVVCIGDPREPSAWMVCEGLKDALALGSRLEGCVITTIGADIGTHLSIGSTNEQVAASGVPARVYADRDEVSMTGQKAGLRTVDAIRRAGVSARLLLPPEGFKDAGEWAGATAFPNVSDALVSYRDTLMDIDPQLPEWEAARIASIALS